jgi:Family of unknown function (DUF5937)/Helix-turn-helix domain
VDKLQDNATSANGIRVTFIPSVFGSPHLVTVHAQGWQPVVQYPVAEPSLPEPVSLNVVERRLEALAHPVRLRLVRTLARSPHTTSELARAWDLTPPGSVPPPRGLAPCRPAHHRTARPLRALHRGPSGAGSTGNGPAGGDAAVTGGLPSVRAQTVAAEARPGGRISLVPALDPLTSTPFQNAT